MNQLTQIHDPFIAQYPSISRVCPLSLTVVEETSRWILFLVDFGEGIQDHCVLFKFADDAVIWESEFPSSYKPNPSAFWHAVSLLKRDPLTPDQLAELIQGLN